MSSVEPEDRARKERSPSFPFIPLSKAVERADTMFDAHKRSPARIGVVGETWGYSASSSGLIQSVAALKAYGLLDDVGKGSDRRVQLSDLALRILHDTRPGAQEIALREAAMRPKLLNEYLSVWLPERPSDAHCISELTLDRGFTQDAAKAFVRIFDDNTSFAGLKSEDKSDYVRETSGTGADSKNVVEPTRREARVPDVQPSAGQQKPPTPSATLPLPEGLVTLTFPAGLSDRSVAAVKNWITVILDLATWPATDRGPTDHLKMGD